MFVVLGLSYSEACKIFPAQELNPCLLHWQADSLPLSHQGSLVLLFTTGLSTPYYLTPVLNYTFMLIAQPLGAFEFVMHDLHTQTTKAF